MMLCAIWNHFYNFKKVKTPWKSDIFLESYSIQPATFSKTTLLHGCFSRFLNSTNGSKSGKASHVTCFRNINLVLHEYQKSLKLYLVNLVVVTFHCL